MTAPFDFGIHLDLFSGANTPFGIAEGRNPYKRGQAAQDAAFVLRIVEAMRAPFLYLDVSKAYVPPMPPRQMHGDGLLRMKQAKIPYALEFEAAFARVYAAVPTMVYVGWCVESWERVYPMFRGCSAIAQDYSGTATGTELLELLEANDTGTNTIVEGPANSDTLLRLGAVCTTQNWGAYERLKQHQGLKVCLCNEPNHPEFYDLDMWGLPFEGNADKPGWGPHWAARCRADGVVPVFPVFTANGLVNAEQFRTPAPVDRE